VPFSPEELLASAMEDVDFRFAELDRGNDRHVGPRRPTGDDDLEPEAPDVAIHDVALGSGGVLVHDSQFVAPSFTGRECMSDPT
jgi:hypothetical protein